MKTVLGVLAAAGMLVVGLGVMSPDGLQPPPGPIMDTQPSLTTISEQITGLQASASSFPTDLRFRHNNIGGDQQDVTVEFVPSSEAAFVRIYAVCVTASSSELLVGPDQLIVATLGGSAVSDDGQLQGSSQFQFGGLRVPTPVRFRTAGQDSTSDLTLLYWVDE